MMRTFILISVICYSFALRVGAQNARVDALGGAGIVDDIAGVIGAPADINAYSGIAQATAYTGSFGPFIALNNYNAFSYGILGNTQTVAGSFYGDAASFINANLFPVNNSLQALPVFMIPHILLGGRITPDVEFGVDLYFEMSHTADRDDSVSVIITDSRAGYYHPGINLNANITAGDIAISPVLGFGIPFIHGYTDYVNKTINSSTAIDVYSLAAFFLNSGVEFDFALGAVRCILGGLYQLELYQFAYQLNRQSSSEVEAAAHQNHLGVATAGLLGELGDNLAFIVQYDFELDFDRAVSELQVSGTTTETVESDITHTHTLAVGLEKGLDRLWIFDMIRARAGANVGLSGLIERIDETASGGQTYTAESRTIHPVAFSNIIPTIGLGFAIKKFQFDIVTRLAAWQGFTSGPPIVEGTATIDFGGTVETAQTGRTDSKQENLDEIDINEEAQKLAEEEKRKARKEARRKKREARQKRREERRLKERAEAQRKAREKAQQEKLKAEKEAEAQAAKEKAAKERQAKDKVEREQKQPEVKEKAGKAKREAPASVKEEKQPAPEAKASAAQEKKQEKATPQDPLGGPDDEQEESLFDDIDIDF
ncbi:MAG: hypothetical protein GF398_13210 [Chitinivibrionales bacterium]|nr:hypothetical protein [Chitinivibrionales bacterium]